MTPTEIIADEIDFYVGDDNGPEIASYIVSRLEVEGWEIRPTPRRLNWETWENRNGRQTLVASTAWPAPLVLACRELPDEVTEADSTWITTPERTTR